MKDKDDSTQREKDVHRQGGVQPRSQTVSPESVLPAKAAFSQKQQKYRVLVESAPLGIALVDGQGRYNYLNPKFVEMFGYALDDIPSGQKWFAKAYPDAAYREQVISDWKLYLEESQVGEAKPRTFNVTCKDGSAKVIKFRAVPLEEGEQFILYEDVTELQEAEEARREAEEIFRVLYECAPDAFFLHENDKILEVNRHACDSLGYSREELLSMNISDIEVGLSPEELAAYWQQPFLPHTVSGVLRRKDGSTFPVEVRASNFEYRRRKLRLALVRDITERLQAEEALKGSELKYRTLVEQIPAITYTTNLDDYYTTTYVSPQVESILGFTPADFKAEPYLWAKKLHPEDRDWVFTETAKCLERGEPFTAEYRMIARDGRIVWLRDQAQVVKDSSGSHLFLQGVMLDVTKHKELKEALQESETHYRILFETTPDAILLFDRDLNLTMANAAAATLYGVEGPSEMVGLSAFEFVAPESLPLAQKLASERLDSEDVIEEEFVLLKKDGSSFLAETRTSVLRHPDGSLKAFLAIARDITERKLAEEALKKSEEKYRLLVSQIPAVVFKGYKDWSIECFDDKVETLTGYSREDFNSRRLTWRDLIPAEELPYVKQVFQEALQGDGSYFREHRIRKKNGKYAWVHCRGQIFHDEQGEVDYINGVTFDVTAQKQTEDALRESEELYRLITENVRDVIWTTTLDLQISYISPSVRQLLGFTPEELIGKAVGEFFSPESTALALEVLSEEMSREMEGNPDLTRTRTLEIEQRHKDGSVIWTELKASFIRDAAQQPIGILGVTRDTTKRKQAEQALHRREAILEAVSFAAEKFLKSHFWKQDIQEVLGRLGQAVGVSRVYIFENHLSKDGALLTSLRNEWVEANIKPQLNNPEFQGFPYGAAGFSRWEELLSQGRIICGQVAKFPPSEQELLLAQDIKSILVVPIFVGQHWWGGIGFDDCIQAREWSSMEIDALLTAASILGLTTLHLEEERALRESEEKLRSLSYQLLTSQEQERKRFATELHDVLGHDLLILKLELENLHDELVRDHAPQKERVQRIIESLQDSVGNVSGLCQDLGPGDLEDLGLTKSLHFLVDNFAQAKKLTWQTVLDDITHLFAFPTETAIYRVVQEALTNIGKHAEANHVLFRVRKEGRKVSFTIEDDGKGFDPEAALQVKKSLGLLSMEERVKFLGGTYEISNRVPRGTRVSFTIPLSEE